MSMDKAGHLLGKKFRVVTLGCRVNHYESEAIASMLERRGALFVADGAEGGRADIVIVVTCSVTSVAAAKTRKTLRRFRRENPDSLIAACGCWAQVAGEEEARSSGADILVGNRVKEHIADEIERWYESSGSVSPIRVDLSECREWDSLSLDRPRMSTRAFLKVQDGCDRSCSYCVVSRLRGPSVSRDMYDAVAEAARIAASGAGEIILTGVQLGGYQSGGAELADLVAEISRVPGLKRLRLGSLEPFSLTEKLLAAMRDSEAFCPHIHLPLQSGDDEILGAMRRGYSASDFANTVAMTRKYLGDDAHISTDLLVGFPGESEAAFERSMSLLRRLALGKVHVFPYSPREGTDSAVMKQLPSPIVKERTGRALALAEKLLSEYAARMVGRADSVLVENVANGAASGWSRHYLRVYLRAEGREKNLIGNEFFVCPKTSIGSILLCEGVDREKIIFYADE